VLYHQTRAPFRKFALRRDNSTWTDHDDASPLAVTRIATAEAHRFRYRWVSPVTGVVAYLSILVVGILGFLAGVLVGLYLVGGGGVTLALAALAVIAAFCSPLLVSQVEQASDRRKEGVRIRGENRERFERHALALNSHAFAPMNAVVLQSPLASPPLSGKLDRPRGTGLHVLLANAQQAPVEGLPNWPLASEHLYANPKLKQCWEETVAKARTYYELREATFNATIAKLSQLVEAEYGPEMRTAGRMGDNPPWFDVAGVAWFIIGRRGPLNRQDFYSPGVSPEASPDLPRTISTGGGFFLSARNAAEGDTARFKEIFDAIWRDPQLGPEARATAAAESIASASVSELREQVRVYSNKILVSHTFEGECEVCRTWTPR
jgi:hypothetical protein